MTNKCAHTFGVVLLHVLKAADAASIACFVWLTPTSATCPSSSEVAGSTTLISGTAEPEMVGRTGDRELLAILCVHPLTINEALVTDETGILESKLLMAALGLLSTSSTPPCTHCRCARHSVSQPRSSVFGHKCAELAPHGMGAEGSIEQSRRGGHDCEVLCAETRLQIRVCSAGVACLSG